MGEPLLEDAAYHSQNRQLMPKVSEKKYVQNLEKYRNYGPQKSKSTPLNFITSFTCAVCVYGNWICLLFKKTKKQVQI